MTNKKEKSSKKSVFLCCCPFATGKSNTNNDEMGLKLFGKEFTEYEYVIENLAIRRAPKVLLDSIQPSPKKSLRTTQTIKPCAKDCSTLAVKTSPQEVILGPVIETDLSGGDCSVAKEIYDNPCCPCPVVPQYRCMVRDKAKDDFILKKVLLPPNQIQRVEHQKVQVVADIHKTSVDDGVPKKDLKAIPAEIQTIIDALKVAKPQITSASLRKNKLNLMRSVSDTSCDNKETFCNFLGETKAYTEVEHLKGETTEDTRSSLNESCFESKRKSLSRFLQQSKKINESAEPSMISNQSNSKLIEYCTSQILLPILIFKYVFLIVYLWTINVFMEEGNQ